VLSTAEPLERRTLLSTIVWTNRGTAQNDSDNFNSCFGVNAALARSVIDAAIQTFQRVIVNFNYSNNSNTYNLNVSMDGSGTGFGGAASGISYDGSGKPVSGTVELSRGNDTNADGKGDGAGYFLDPTPLDNSEFEGAIANPFSAQTPGGPNMTDLFTLFASEVCHCVGLGGDSQEKTLSTNTGVPDPAGAGTYWRFDGPSIKTLLTSANGNPVGDYGGPLHRALGGQTYTFNGTTYYGADDSNNFSYSNNQRKLFSNADALMLKDIYGYTITLPETFGTYFALLQSNGTLLVRGGNGSSNDQINLWASGGNLFVSIDLGIDFPQTGTDGAMVSSFPLASVNNITLQPGDGNDTVTIQNCNNIPIALSDASAVNHLLVEPDASSPVNIGTTSITGGGVNLNWNQFQWTDLYVGGQAGSEILNYNSHFSIPVTLDGGIGNDTITVNAASNNGVTVTGGDGADLVTLNTFDGSGAGCTVQGGAGNDTVTVSRWSNLLSIDGEDDADRINLEHYGDATHLTLLGGNGNDTLAVGGVSGDLLSTTSDGFINFNGNGGSNTVEIDDNNDSTYDWVYTVASNTIRMQQITPWNRDFNVNFQNVATLTINAGAANDTVSLLAGPNQINVNAAAGNDNIAIGNGQIAGFVSNVTTNAGVGTDTLTLNDSLDAINNLNWAIYDLTIFLGLNSYDYSGFESASVLCGTGGNDVQVNSTRTGVPVSVNLGGGNDTMHVSPSGKRLSDIQSTVSVDGGGGTDAVTLDDSNDNGIVNTLGVTSSAITFPTGALNYSNIDGLTFNGGPTIDGVSVASTTAATPVTIAGGDGNDVLQLGFGTIDAFLGPLYFDAGNGSDRINVQDGSTTIGATYNLNLLAFQRILNSVPTAVLSWNFNNEEVDLFAGSGNDTINGNSVGTVFGGGVTQIFAGGGND
jgi:hypothetical protein